MSYTRTIAAQIREVGKMSEKFHPTLLQDTKYYQKSYQTFSRFMDCDAPYEPWFGHVLGKILRDKLMSERDNRNGQTSSQLVTVRAPPAESLLRHMGVGSGSGELELQILWGFLGNFKYIYNLVIEPSTHQIDLYQKLVQRHDGLSTSIEFDWRQQTLEDYRADDYGRGRGTFDVITSVHSIYYGDLMEVNVPFLFDQLAVGGVLAIVLISDADSLSRVQGHFLSPSIAGYRYYTKQMLQSFLTTYNIAHQIVDVPQCNIDVTPCFDNHSAEGSLLVDFLSHMKHFRTEVSPELRGRFLSLLRQNAHTVGNKMLVTHDTSAVIIQRTNKRKFSEYGSNTSHL